MNKIKKILFFSIIFIITLIILYILYNAFFYVGENEIYLIPKGFKGIVTIIFNEKDYPVLKHEGGELIFEIPHNGILITSDKYPEKWHKERYFLIGSNQNKEEIFYKIPIDSTYEGEQIFNSRFGSAGLKTKKEVICKEFIVCKYSELDSLSRLMDKIHPEDYIP